MKKKLTCYIVDFAVQKVKEGEKLDKCWNIARELKKATEHENDRDTNRSLGPQNCLQNPGKRDPMIWRLKEELIPPRPLHY